MSSATYGTYIDAPDGIERDSTGLNLVFTRTDGTTGTISWTVPSIEQQAIRDGTTNYNGIVIVGSQSAITQTQHPVNGQTYEPDATMNADVHLGDMINGAFVLANTYGDLVTQTVTVTGLLPGKEYFFAGFAVDNVYRYSSGSFSYSLELRVTPINGTDPYAIVLYPKELTDPIELEAGNIYQFTASIGDNDNTVEYLISIDPTLDDVSTFEKLIATINDKLARTQANVSSDDPPNINNLYIENNVVKLWNGYVGVAQPTIYSSTDPTTPSEGDSWYDGDVFYRHDGNQYLPNRTIVSSTDPRIIPCSVVWINPTDPTVAAYNKVGGAWVERRVFQQSTNPLIPPPFNCSSIWYDENTFHQFISVAPSLVTCSNVSGYWIDINVLYSDTSPLLFDNGLYWFNPMSGILSLRNSDTWGAVEFTNSTTTPTAHIPWFNPATKTVYLWNSITSAFEPTQTAVSVYDPFVRPNGHLWFDGTSLYRWDSISGGYIVSELIISSTDPLYPAGFVKGDVWYDGNTVSQYDGSQFVTTDFIVSTDDPTTTSVNDYWFNPTNQTLYVWNGSNWTDINYITFPTDPSLPSAGTFWYNGSTAKIWNGIAWGAIITGPNKPTIGYTWYDGSTLWMWNGSSYIPQDRYIIATYDTGNIKFTGMPIKCNPRISIVDGSQPIGQNIRGLFKSTRGIIQRPVSGLEYVDGKPLYTSVGVGTDGNQAHRRELVENMLYALGYPSIQVELTKPQLQFCVDQALQELRRRSSLAYERTYFFLQLEPGIQHYSLTSECVGFNKIVSVLEIHRVNATFLGKAEGHGAFGQLIMQQLYQMGTFDMVSYHIMSDYMETLEMMTAGKMQFTWREQTRRLSISQRIVYPEKIMIDASIERTEQSIMQDRMCKNWILNWALAEAKQILAGIRGKFQTMPSASGGVSLNASDLQAQADKLFEQCRLELDEYIASDPENWGMASQFVVG